MASPGITWLGHASTLIELGGVRMMTDPAITPRLAHLRRHHEVDPAHLERPDLVLISHLHMDHLHVPSLRLLGDDLELVVPAGAGSMLRRRGFGRIREVRAGDTVDVDGVRVEVVPAVHSARRGPHTRIAADAVGYVLRSDERSVYFPGDTDLFPQMTELGTVDVALLPIWGWGSHLGPGHLDPSGAARATELIDPGAVVPIHWGTYSPVAIRRSPPTWLRTPVELFEDRMAQIGARDRLHVVAPGGSFSLAIP
jgi:L-ascorbate metabolism protein UlaG (beta-lactamase superfamily)